MNTKETATFIKKRIRKLAEQARKHPHTALAAYAYFELVRKWAKRNRDADLADAAREAKDYILAVAA